MKAFAILNLFLIACFFIQAQPLLTEVKLNGVRPTQTDIGLDRIKKKTKEYQAKWKKAHPKGKVTFEEFVTFELIIKKSFPAIIDPTGNIYILDGHHRTFTFSTILRDYPELLDQANFKVEVIADYTGKSQKDFAKGLIVDHGKGYFPRSIRNKNLSPMQLVQLLPENIEDLINNPMRSLIGEVFDFLILDESLMADYIQFYLGEKVDDLNLKINKDKLLSEKNIEKVANAILKDRDIIKFLLESPRSEELEELNNKQIVEKLNEFLNKAERRKLARPKKLKGKCLLTLKLLLG